MTQQPVVARTGYTVNRHIILLAIAVVLFIIAAIVALGDATVKWEAALIPAGLAFFAASFL